VQRVMRSCERAARAHHCTTTHHRCTTPNPSCPLNPDTHTEVPHLKEASAEHERCFTALMNTGGVVRGKERRSHCEPELEALKAGLRKVGAYPFKV